MICPAKTVSRPDSEFIPFIDKSKTQDARADICRRDQINYIIRNTDAVILNRQIQSFPLSRSPRTYIDRSMAYLKFRLRC